MRTAIISMTLVTVSALLIRKIHKAKVKKATEEGKRAGSVDTINRMREAQLEQAEEEKQIKLNSFSDDIMELCEFVDTINGWYEEECRVINKIYDDLIKEFSTSTS